VKYAVIYSVSSVQRLLDFVKTVYAFDNATPVIVKPIGGAAQAGLPEAYRLSYKRGKPLLLFPELTDLYNVLGVEKAFFLTPNGSEVSVDELEFSGRVAYVVHGSDSVFTRGELQYGEAVWVKGVPRELPSHILIPIILYSLSTSSLDRK